MGDCCGLYGCCMKLGACYVGIERVWGVLASITLLGTSIAAMFIQSLSDSMTCGNNDWTDTAIWYSLLAILALIGLLLVISHFQWKWFIKHFNFFKSRLGRFLIKGITGWMLILFGLQNELLAAKILGGFVASAAIVHLIGLCPCIIIPKESSYKQAGGAAGGSVSASA